MELLETHPFTLFVPHIFRPGNGSSSATNFVLVVVVVVLGVVVIRFSKY